MMRSKCASCRPTCGPNAHPGGDPQGKELLARRRQSMTRTPGRSAGWYGRAALRLARLVRMIACAVLHGLFRLLGNFFRDYLGLVGALLRRFGHFV